MVQISIPIIIVNSFIIIILIVITFYLYHCTTLIVAVLSISLVIQEFLTTTITHIFSTIAFIFFCTEPPNIFDATILIVNLFLAPFFNHFYSRTLLLKVKKIRPQTRSILHINPINSTIPFSFRQLNPMRI